MGLFREDILINYDTDVTYSVFEPSKDKPGEYDFLPAKCIGLIPYDPTRHPKQEDPDNLGIPNPVFFDSQLCLNVDSFKPHSIDIDFWFFIERLRERYRIEYVGYNTRYSSVEVHANVPMNFFGLTYTKVRVFHLVRTDAKDPRDFIIWALVNVCRYLENERKVKGSKI